jgi:hypothetical protein
MFRSYHHLQAENILFARITDNGLLYKLGRSFPLNYFLILKSYLHNRHFLAKVETEYTELFPANAGELKAVS